MSGDASQGDSLPDDDHGKAKRKVCGFLRPSLLEDLRNILREYPDNEQIFKEILQNAEDAGAKTVKILSVLEDLTVQEPEKKKRKKDESTAWRPDFAKMFSMPGLCVYNDALFTEDDWLGIMKLHDSVKVKDPLKVGRFGLGFKSVFHMTDHPIIISGDFLLLMDPFRDEHEAIYRTSLDDLQPKSKERKTLLSALTPLLKVLAENSLTDQRFEGTVFWFPLRQKPSDLSETVYTSRRIHDLMQAFRSEISTMPLFLKRLEKIQVFCAETKSQTSSPVLDFFVELNEECLAAVRDDREKFISGITTKNKICPKKEISVVSRLVLDTGRKMADGQMEMNKQCWIIIHFHQGTDDMLPQLQDLCQRKYLSHRPYVGVAIPLNSPLRTFQGQLFCFLPLPPEKPSPTGLPVHIHGYFELSENRRHIDWPKSEEETDTGPSDEKLVWNRLLIKEVLPRAYVKLVSDLVKSERDLFGKTSPEQEANLDRVANLVYELCPNPDSVTSHCQLLLTSFYQKLSSCQLFFTHVKGGQWVFLESAVVMAAPSGDTHEAAEEAVSKVYEVCEINLVRLPSHIVHGLQKAVCQIRESETDSILKIVCPENLIDLMKRNKRWVEGISGEQKRLILNYLCLHDGSFFEELELLPLADGSFCSFCDHKVHVCRDKQELSLLPGLLNQLCYVTEPSGLEKHLFKLANSEFGKLQLMTDADIPTLLFENVESQYPNFTNITVPFDNPWIRHVWDYLQRQDEDLSNYNHLPLLPCIHDEILRLKPLDGNYLCAMLKGFPPAPEALIKALEHLGVYVVPSLPDFLHHAEIVHSRVQPASQLGVLKCLARLSLTSETLETAVKVFNLKSNTEEKEALVDILAGGKDTCYESEKDWTNAKAMLRRLELFPVWPGCVGRAETEESQAAHAGFKTRQTKSSAVKHTSVRDNCDMTPDNATTHLPPSLSSSPELLHCSTQSQRLLASHLGAREFSLTDLVESMLKTLKEQDHGVNSDSEVVDFMIYCLQSPVFGDQKIRDLARQVNFLPSCLTRKLRKVDKIYDPDSKLLQELFAEEDRFPDELFCKGTVLESLRQIGLRSDECVTDDDLLQTATEIDTLCKSSENIPAVKKKANALWKFLIKSPEREKVLKSLANLQCLPCIVHKNDVPPGYPSKLPVCPKEYQTLGISSVKDMCDHAEFKVIASVRPVSLPVDSNHPVCALFCKPTPTEIIQHLTVVASEFDRKQSHDFASVLHLIYSKLNEKHLQDSSSVCKELKNVECIRTEKDGCFRPPAKFWAEREKSDVDLWPYRFQLPIALTEELTGLFVACGCSERQDCTTLRDVLLEIQDKHSPCPALSKEKWSRDFELAQAIPEAIVKKGEPDNDRGGTLLPVYTSNEESLQFALARDCTVAPDVEVIKCLTEDEEEETLTFVHPDFDRKIALDLGALDLAEKTKTGVNDLPIDDSNFGQYEPLTTRLHNLLREGYTDGFSIPKELIQNADDAGATVVKFLVDERENRDWRTGIQPPTLADFQGAALWVYNDSEFSGTDFSNLCKLGGATKKEDCSKVGKFGLGFNAVYNITEIPSIYSGSVLALLDPHEMYLLDKKRGKLMNFKDITNKAFLKRLPNQFRPFQGVFDCDLMNKTWHPYPGTLFRFPFRTESQADKSLIRKEAFTSENRDQFMKDLMSKAGNLLLFLQNVTRVELYHLQGDQTDPSQAECLMSLERKTWFETASPRCNILQLVSKAWKNAVEQRVSFEEQNIIETVTVSMTTNQMQECIFRIAWSTGQEESCAIAKEKSEEGFVPLAGVGIFIGTGGFAIPIEKCPRGFYQTGHLFCFLPLAEQVSETKLLVHINAPFALRSDRKGLLAETDDDKTIIEGRWNKALFRDPIPRAYLSALESLADSQTPPELYYHLWPKHTPHQIVGKRSPQHELCPNFYRLIVQNGGLRVFLCEAGCCGFSDSFFFDPDFKETDDGKVAFGVLKKFWKETQWGYAYLIDLPFHIIEDIRVSEQQSAFNEKVITKGQFFAHILFPKIAEGNTFLTAEERNKLVLHALLSDSTELQELVKSHKCIPCGPHGHLLYPKQVIHPKGYAAPLFTEEDARFPQKLAKFTSDDVLHQLMNLGMVKDIVSIEELHLRAQSLKEMPQIEKVIQRVQAIIRYLPHLGHEMEKYINTLRNVEFLPVQEKAKDWPLQWFGEGRKFEKPSHVFSNKLKDLVGCKASVLLEEPLDLSRSDWEILKKLGVIQYKAEGDTRLTDITVCQLLSIAEEYKVDQHSKKNSKIIEGICKEIYKHLNSFCGQRRQVMEHKELMKKLKEQPVVWTDQGFQEGKCLALGSEYEFEPYLVFVDGNSWGCAMFFSFLGVKQEYGVPEILSAMKNLANDLHSRKLTKRNLKCILGMANLLREALHGCNKNCLEEDEIDGLFLPDIHEMLHPVTDLCLNDCDWLTESDTMHFLHTKFSEDLALAFGVKTKREHDEDEFSEPFGQSEKLTNRINRLLEGYTRDISIFKELVQNADDAGASEIRFVKDLRCHNTEKLLNERWKEVFGPALCVFNDASFTPRDMQGIQDLGEGSKEADTFKTGKYGVGFNAVYNLTDTPSFWTRVVPEHGDTSQVPEKVLGEKLCVLDPNFFVTSPRSKKPGQQLTVTDRFKDQYSNMLSPFLLEEESIQNQAGTVFRLPLRTKEKAAESKIKQAAVNMEEVQKILKDFQNVMGECLLFLRSVKKIGVYTAKEDGTIVKEYETQLTADEVNMRKHKEFFEHINNEARRLKNENVPLSLHDFISKEVTLQCCLSASDCSTEEWLVVHRFGLFQSENIPNKLKEPGMIRKHKLLPLGGVALCLSQQEDVCGSDSVQQSSHNDENDQMFSKSRNKANKRKFKAFCMLPLPVHTGLPVHINGRFALSHETRGDIITQQEKDMYVWNKLLADCVVVPAYVTALLCFPTRETSLSRKFSLENCRSLTNTLSHYSNFFPDHQVEMDTFWKTLMESFYQHLAQTEASVFPAVRKDLDCVLWVPAVRSTGFSGYFTNVEQEYPHLKRVLMNLNMNIIECPYRIHEAFVASSVYKVKCVSEETVVEFLQSCDKDESFTDSCNLKHLPKCIRDTAFKCLRDVHEVFKFLKNIKSLEGLPLSLRMSDQLHVFSRQQPTIVSKFCKLFPGSRELFLHSELVSLVMNNQLSHVCDYLKKLDIKTVAELLPKTLDQSVFGCGKTLLLNEVSSLPLQVFSLSEWIQQLWTLFETLIQRCQIPTDPLRKWSFSQIPTEDLLEPLKKWSFIPAVNDKQVYLFPLQEKDKVVHIPVKAVNIRLHQNEHDIINSILDKLLLNKLDIKLLPSASVATQIVASVTKPEGLLTALVSAQNHCLQSIDAQNILDFFFRKFGTCIRQYFTAIRSLPFFEKTDGSFLAVGDARTVLCLPDVVPQDGLNDWCSNTHTILLKENNQLKYLFEQLAIKCPGVKCFYLEYLLCSISQLPFDDIPKHMEYIRDHCWCEEVFHVLRQTAFIKGIDGTLSLASSFYSPYCRVFELMMKQNQFPPAPYNEIKWRKFLEKVGMVTEVSEDMFLHFARQVAESGKNSVSGTLKQQSKELVRYLRGSHSLRKRSFLTELKTIKFLIPWSEQELEQGDVLRLIHPFFRPPSPLVSFAECLSSHHCFLVWTNTCILPSIANPSQFTAWAADMYESIGLKKEPSLELVVKHVENVCQVLNRKGKGGISELSHFTGEQMDIVEKIMEAVYNYLLTVHNHQEGIHDKLEALKSVAVIFDKEKKAVFYPNQVVIGLRECETIEGHVMRAPEVLGKFFKLFRELGVHDKVCLNHYGRALERIDAETRGSYLDPNELKLVTVAVHNLFILLKDEPSEDSLLVPTLYLPGEEIAEKEENSQVVPLVRMIASRELILEINQTHKRRLKTFIGGHVFVNFNKLNLKGHHLHYETDLLPEQHKMQKWHDVVRETVQESCRCLAMDDNDTQSIKERIQSSEFVLVIKRLVNDIKIGKGQKFTEDDAKDIEERLNRISVLKTKNLMTVLMWKGSELPDTTEKKKFFVVKERGHPIEKVFLYIDSQETCSGLSKIKHLLPSLHRTVEWAMGCKFPALLDHCFENLSSATEIMDDEGITPYENWQSTSIAFPPPGSIVPKELHFMLDQDVYEFKLSEVVAHEVHDPVLVHQSQDRESSAQETSGSTSADHVVKTPTYIFATVQKVIKRPFDESADARTRLLLLRYVIDIGQDEEKEVEACELYKFVRPVKDTRSLVPFKGDASLSSFSLSECSDNIKKTLKEIRHQLRQIWQTLKDKKSRMRAVKRLFLKWHPDKNPDRKDFCTKVFQKIQHYVEILDSSSKLDSDGEDDVDSQGFGDGRRRRHWGGSRSGNSWSTFFDDLSSRASFYNESRSRFRSDGRGRGRDGRVGSCFSHWYGSGGSSHPNPQPEEGSRWMRQAEKDLDTAREMLQHRSTAFNWVCYQAHQAAEKALKAVLYHRDAGLDCRNSHSICEIASRVGDESVKRPSESLEKALGYHTRMRYPGFSHDYPKIPSEIYCESDGTEALNLAEEIVTQARVLLGRPSRKPSPPPPPPPPRPTSTQASPRRRRNQMLTSSSSRPQISGNQSRQSTSTAKPLPALPPP